jgi:two-component system, OmpR family, sensor histidine kinase TctE
MPSAEGTSGYPSPPPPIGVMAGLRRRLLILLLLPLLVLACISAWFDYQAAGSAALLQDQQLLRFVPLVAGSVVAEAQQALDAPVVLLAPAIEDFMKDRKDLAAWGLSTVDGRVLVGPAWLTTPTPSTNEPEFHSEFVNGVTYRIVAQRARTPAGDLVALLADGSDARQNWVQSLVLKVLLPNLLLIIAAALAVNWAVQRALQTLLALKEALENRSPRDLSTLDTSSSPEEVRPLVESLNRLFAMVTTQAESQRRFIADAAHQLRTPLAGLQAQVEAWAQAVHALQVNIHKEKTAQAQQNIAQSAIKLGADEINRLRHATRRTSQLANQLLALSRADAQSGVSQPMHSVDLQTLCSAVLEQQLDAATAKGIDLGMDIDTTRGALIALGHDWLLRELLTNLCDNAIRYTPAGGAVTLRCQHSGGGLLLQVCDDGPGIAVQERSRVLERFYRVQGTAGEGTGLGLAIADEIARLHGTQLVLGDATDAAVPADASAEVTTPQAAPAAHTPRAGLCVSVLLATAPLDGARYPAHDAPAFTRGIRAQ